MAGRGRLMGALSGLRRAKVTAAPSASELAARKKTRELEFQLNLAALRESDRQADREIAAELETYREQQVETAQLKALPAAQRKALEKRERRTRQFK